MGNKPSSSKKKCTRNSKDSLAVPQEHDGNYGSYQFLPQAADNTEHETKSSAVVSESYVKQGPPAPCPALGKSKELHKPNDDGNDDENGDGNDDGNDDENVNGNDDENVNGNDDGSEDGNDNGRDIEDPLPPDKSKIQRDCHQRISQRTNTSSAESTTESSASADSAYTDTTNDSTQACASFNCITCRTQHMEYMTTEVYKRRLQNDLRVEEILSDLHCIDAPEKEEIEKKSKESRQGAVDLLLQSIQSSDEPGKWQNFIEALERADYSFIVKLLKGEIENDHDKNKKLLSLMSRQLINNIHIEECLDMLFSEELINERDRQDIESEHKNSGPIAAADKMFKIVPTKSPEWDKRLPVILDKCGLSEVAQLLRFSEEFPVVTPTEQTDLKKYKCSHNAEQRHHYTNRSRNSIRHEVHNGDLHNYITDSSLLSEIRKCIRNLSKKIEGGAQRQLSTIQTPKETHIKDLKGVTIELKQISSAVDKLKEKLNENDILLNEIKGELKDQRAFIETMNQYLQKQFDELKTSVLNNNKISAFSPPEACHRSGWSNTADSGFSGGTCSIQEECLEIQTDFGDHFDIAVEYCTKF